MKRTIRETLPFKESKTLFRRLPRFVLVEDEELIRALWIQIAIKKGLPLAVYDSPESFLRDLHLFSNHSIFCLDQDFGNRRGIGVWLARKIKTKYQAFVCLVTNYSQDIFRGELETRVLNQVCGKFPWPFNSGKICSFDQVGVLYET